MKKKKRDNKNYILQIMSTRQ